MYLDVTERQGVTGTIGLAGAALAVGVLTVALGQAIEEENNKKSDVSQSLSIIKNVFKCNLSR